MRLGLDFDGTCFDFGTPFLAYFNNRNGTKFKIEQITKYEWYECLEGVTEELFYDTLRDFNDNNGWNSVKLYPGVAEGLQRAQLTNLLYGVTVRTGNGPKAAAVHLEAAGIAMIRIGMPKPGETKAHVCDEMAIDVLFDDRPRYCKQVAETGIPVLCINQRYNEPWKIPPELPILRTPSLVEGLKEFESFVKFARRKYGLATAKSSKGLNS